MRQAHKVGEAPTWMASKGPCADHRPSAPRRQSATSSPSITNFFGFVEREGLEEREAPASGALDDPLLLFVSRTSPAAVRVGSLLLWATTCCCFRASW